MKIQTQFRLLIFGILIVPALIILSEILFRRLSERETRREDRREEPAEIPAYEEMTALLDTRMSPQAWESLTRHVSRLRFYRELAIFRDDFLVLYSTIPEFKTGASESIETILPLLTRENTRYDYNFVFSGRSAKHGSILFRRAIETPGQGSGFNPGQRPPVRHSMPPLFPPILIAIIPILLLIMFAVGMSLFIARSITKSVQVLEDATRRIAGGELDLAVDVRGSNEITSLTSSLNKMRKALKEEERRRYRFIMGITHDLKTPLALIKGYAEAIEDGLTDDPVSRTGAVEIIASKADQLEGMIDDLLDFVRMESGEWRSRLKPVNLTAFLGDLVKGMIPDVELLRHRMEAAVDLPDPLYVPLDERIILRALENLVNNAIRYTPDDTIIRLSAVLAGNAVVLTLSDNGPGIAAADLPHVFETFYRGSASRREQGLGLGLSVVKWAADSHGWSISVSSPRKHGGEDAPGTCFTITIPHTPI